MILISRLLVSGVLGCVAWGLVAGVEMATAQNPRFQSESRVVLVPVTVSDSRNQTVDGLDASSFLVTDNGVPQKIAVETADSGVAPVSLVVAIQSAGISSAVLAKVRKISAIFQPVITGENGEIAVVEFDSSIRWTQDFTTNEERIRFAISHLTSGSETGGRMLDTLADATHYMQGRKGRKVVLLISESKDRGSKTKLTEALDLCGREGVQVFAAHYSAYVTPFTAKPEDLPRPSGGTDLLTAIGELTRNGKTNTVKALAQATGGADLSFATQRSLETIIQKFGLELHSQYLISFAAATGAGDGPHQIRVEVRSHPELRLRYRQSY